MKILILGGGLQGLSIGASLYKKGHILDIISNEIQIRKSKFFHEIISESSNYDESLYSILSQTHYDVLIPMGDKNVSFLSKNKTYIESAYSCKCACPNYDVLSIVEDKHLFMEFCEKNMIPHPRTKILTMENMETCANDIRFPAIIKPNFSVGARGITRVESLSALKKEYPNVFNKFGACTLQEFVENQEFYYNVMLYRSKNGHFLAYTIIKIVRMYPVTAGSSSCCISIENPELLQICKDCLNKLNWVGMADFDVLQCIKSKEYKIIEINARVPASLKAAAISGINFPEIIALDTVDKQIPHYIYVPGKIMRYIGLDIMWLLKSKKLFKNKPSWWNFYGKNVYYQDIYREDISTWWTWLLEGIMKLSRKNKRLR